MFFISLAIHTQIYLKQKKFCSEILKIKQNKVTGKKYNSIQRVQYVIYIKNLQTKKQK